MHPARGVCLRWPGLMSRTAALTAEDRRPGASGAPLVIRMAFALAVPERTLQWQGPATVGVDRPCTPPAARAFGGPVPCPDP